MLIIYLIIFSSKIRTLNQSSINSYNKYNIGATLIQYTDFIQLRIIYKIFTIRLILKKYKKKTSFIMISITFTNNISLY